MNLSSLIPNPRATAWGIHLVGIAVLSCSAAAAFVFVLTPRHAVFAKNEAHRRALQSVMGRAPEVRTQYEKLHAALEEQKLKQLKFRERLPGDPQEDEFLAQVSRLARTVDLAVREYRPGKVANRDNYAELEVELLCEGSYESICRLLAGLPELPRLSSLTGVEVEAKPEQSLYPIRLKLSAYFVPMKNDERS